ncbi:hypothetical protein AN456_17135 [Pseudomonas aeruginosa]|nr:hypothetical protein AN455_21025 [Pseudomonas aeruginosa]KRV01450.1 hypothetical protein AN456_17135 [Pseudomonas aeruginosa]RPP83350.1 hypothetical protein IPC1152_04245 [Pseudomonas aeruginosa]
MDASLKFLDRLLLRRERLGLGRNAPSIRLQCPGLVDHYTVQVMYQERVLSWFLGGTSAIRPRSVTCVCRHLMAVGSALHLHAIFRLGIQFYLGRMSIAE